MSAVPCGGCLPRQVLRQISRTISGSSGDTIDELQVGLGRGSQSAGQGPRATGGTHVPRERSLEPNEREEKKERRAGAVCRQMSDIEGDCSPSCGARTGCSIWWIIMVRKHCISLLWRQTCRHPRQRSGPVMCPTFRPITTLLHTTGAVDGIKNGAETACKMRVLLLSRCLVASQRVRLSGG